MDYIEITLNDFIKNAGVVGLVFALKNNDAIENEDYIFDNDSLLVKKEYLLNADLTEMYFNALISKYGGFTSIQTCKDNIKILKLYYSGEIDLKEKKINEMLKYIIEKLSSNSIKSAFDTIKDKIDNSFVYEQIIKLTITKISKEYNKEDMLRLLNDLEVFLNQNLVNQYFISKNIIYTTINKFWDNKSFLLRANAKKDIKEFYEKDFVIPLKKYIENINNTSKKKDFCIDCGSKISSKESTDISFINDTTDDLSRKKSAFYNFKVDTFVCPICSFVYSFVPLGFNKFGTDFSFFNSNDSVFDLYRVNTNFAISEKINRLKSADSYNQNYYNNDEITESDIENTKNKYVSWMSAITQEIIYQKTNELSNLQVIVRSSNESIYQFNLIPNDILKKFTSDKAKKYFAKLLENPIIKINENFINVYEIVIMNILNYRDQYDLINTLLKYSIDNNYFIYHSQLVYAIQLFMKGEESMYKGKITEVCRSGKILRKQLLQMSNSSDDSCLRGTIYQLTNALKVRNVSLFLDLILRLYTSVNSSIPTAFASTIDDEDEFIKIGYGFVLGLKDGYYIKENMEEKQKDE